MTRTSDFTRYRLATVIFFAQSFFSASTIAAFTLSPIISVYLSGSEDLAGLPNTVGLVGRAAFAYPFGLMMDRLGRRNALFNGYITAVVGSLLSVWAVVSGSYILFLLGALLIGMSRTAGDQSRFIAAEIFSKERRATIIGLVVFAGTIGSVLGPQVVPWSRRLIEEAGLPPDSGPFAIAAALMAASALIIFLLLRPSTDLIGQEIAAAEAAEDPDSVEAGGEPRPWQEIFRQPLVQLSVLSMSLGFFVMVLVMVITPVHMNQGFLTGLNDDQMAVAVSNVIMWHTLGMFGLSIFSGRLIDLFGRINMIIAGALILAVSTIVSYFAPTILLLSLGLFLLGLGWNFAFVAGSSLLANALAVSERGRMQGAAETIVALASGTASLVVGSIFRLGGYTTVNVLGFVFSIVLLIAAIVLPRRAKRQEVHQKEEARLA